MNDAEELRDLREKVAEYKAMFDLQWTRSREADKLWQAEDPENRAGIWPDLGDLLTWLMNRRTTFTRDDLAELLRQADDLGQVTKAVIREGAIRDGMARTGEGREVVAEMLDSIDAMDQEAVLDLADGEPTTLRDALDRYLAELEKWDEIVPRDRLLSDLGAILAYPWSEEEALIQLHEPHGHMLLEVRHPEDGVISVEIGGAGICRASELSPHAAVIVEQVARVVHRSVLARIIADRDHHVQINGAELASLVQWATNSSGGSWSPSRGSRLSVDAVAGGGVLVRTRPYVYQRPGHSWAKDQEERDDWRHQGGYHQPSRNVDVAVPPTDPDDLPGRSMEEAQPITREQVERALAGTDEGGPE